MEALEFRVLPAISAVTAESWDGLFAHEPEQATPFLRHAFLEALEASGSASEKTGWRARHLTLWRGGRLVAAAPAYARENSEGDFSRDWQWVATAEQMGTPYYPKLILAVPFTPATGRRLLVAKGEQRGPLVHAVLTGARALAKEEGMRSVQVLFPTGEEAVELAGEGFAPRLSFQYHWINEGYRGFSEFLARFSSKRRNAIKRERAAPDRQGIAIRTVRGPELSADAKGWAKAMFDLHRASVDRMCWGMRWVNRGFYERVLSAMPDGLEIVEARRGARLVAAAFNASSGSRLYGRYWGCREEHPFLHFNVCLYHSVEQCIGRGLGVFEGGAGGEHKLLRGFEPALAYSAHLFLDGRLATALRQHLAAERADRMAAFERWRAEAPVLKPKEDRLSER
ncbi:MAG TPA: GNAT family N-acetyltransferase [Anaeromyxobacteraceae bacterium]|nr:GNAT family N-acetyltransferase [Anaeromyxobacteraceae bacterium]